MCEFTTVSSELRLLRLKTGHSRSSTNTLEQQLEIGQGCKTRQDKNSCAKVRVDLLETQDESRVEPIGGSKEGKHESRQSWEERPEGSFFFFLN